MYEFLRFYIHCTSNVLFCISAHVREAASTNVLLVLYNSVNESVFEQIEWASNSTVYMVSPVTFLLNQPFLTNRLILMIQ